MRSANSFAVSFALVALLFAFARPALSQQQVPRIGIEVDRSPVVAGDPFQLTITIESRGKGEPEVKLPSFGRLRVLQRSESHPRSFSFSFGFGQQRTSETTVSSIYTFVLAANQPGKYQIDPVAVVLDGRQYRSNPYTVSVVGAGGGAPAPTPPAQLGAAPAIDDDALAAAAGETTVTDLKGAKVDENYFLQAAVSKTQAVVGEALILTVYLYTAWDISDIDVTREPGTEGFWVENLLPGNRRLTTEPVQVSGKRYDRAILRKVLLFPIKPGKLTIAPALAEIETRSGGFFSTRKSVKRASLPVQIDVAAVPQEGQPSGFDPANVGQYSFKAEVDKTRVKTGEPVTLTLTVRGEGNLRNLVLPGVSEVQGFKVYAPESEVEVAPSGESVTGSRSHRILMIAKEPGTFQPPAVRWSFFDPRSGKFQTQESTLPAIAVLQGDALSATAGSTSSAPSRAPKNAGQDRLNRQLRSILSRSELSRDDSSLLTAPWFLVLALGMPLAYVAMLAASRTRRKLAENQKKGRSKNAGSAALKHLAQLAKHAETTQGDVLFGELQRTLVGFLDDRLEETVAGDTLSELRARLASRGLDDDAASSVIAEMESCDFARFAKSAADVEEKRRAVARMEKLIAKLANLRLRPKKKEREQ